MAPKLSTEERARIVSLLQEHGGNQNKVARLSGRSQPTVRKIAREETIVSINSANKKANAARVAYAEERRLELVGKGFDKADELLETIQDAGEFQRWTVGFGTLVDKARLETGEVTDRSERHNHAHAEDRERRFERLFSQLDAHRANADVDDSAGDRGMPVDSGSADNPAARVP